MDRIKSFLFLAGGLLLVGLVIAYVRLSRAVDAALWELAPEVMRGLKNMAEAAHRDVCARQRSATKPARKASASKTTTTLEYVEDCSREIDRLRGLRRQEKYGTPEYNQLCREIDDVFRRWDVLLSKPVTP